MCYNQLNSHQAEAAEAVWSVKHLRMRAEQKLVILLAEDDRNDAEIFSHALARSGREAKLEIVGDGEEVMEYLRRRGRFRHRRLHPLPDIIILDLKMPRVSGLELLEWLAKTPQFCRIPKIMLSGSGLQPDVERAYKLGVNTYFTKPFRMEELQELIATIINYWSKSELPYHRPVEREQQEERKAFGA